MDNLIKFESAIPGWTEENFSLVVKDFLFKKMKPEIFDYIHKNFKQNLMNLIDDGIIVICETLAFLLENYPDFLKEIRFGAIKIHKSSLDYFKNSYPHLKNLVLEEYLYDDVQEPVISSELGIKISDLAFKQYKNIEKEFMKYNVSNESFLEFVMNGYKVVKSNPQEDKMQFYQKNNLFEKIYKKIILESIETNDDEILRFLILNNDPIEGSLICFDDDREFFTLKTFTRIDSVIPGWFRTNISLIITIVKFNNFDDEILEYIFQNFKNELVKNIKSRGSISGCMLNFFLNKYPEFFEEFKEGSIKIEKRQTKVFEKNSPYLKFFRIVNMF